MDVKAHARYVHMSPRKIRLVIDTIRGKRVVVALQQLQFVNKAASLPVLKLLRSAVANAEHNHQIKAETLYVKTIVADGGPVLDRWRARAMGRAAPIRKRSAHISVVLSDVPVEKKKA
ncbi:MAG: 50S ribosomal protein L22 [Candidatus Uhrbacteria bacterium GW2011_GWA2_53_10]|uniref:Large ribosomal subunit protein uL22 n=1 Tax=Candidatus Uhrbacteria bacterium GW2011_GWA2_53_10 TaxID=1618980 RepID=A0A0G2AL39_9BACT|nr:MAG: 50S ribosomal protein L22 [Candidatus Uhrbacteria bacterium GW2011_GWA2_53_10]